MTRCILVVNVLIASLSTITVAQHPPSTMPPIMRSMEAELARSMAELTIPGMQRPSFLAYRVFDREIGVCNASLGSLTSATPRRFRSAEVELYVGGDTFNNTNFYTGGPQIVNGVYGAPAIPLEDDDYALRRSLWLGTDAAYKDALRNLSRKNAAIENRKRSTALPDFSPATACTVIVDSALYPLATDAAKNLAREVSARFLKYPAVMQSSVLVYQQNLRIYYVNSEGTRFVRTEPSVTLQITAWSQRDDGIPVEDFRRYSGPTLQSLGDAREFMSAADSVGASITALSTAPMAQRYVGPVLFEGDAAVELFNRFMAPMFCSPRTPLCENPGHQAFFPPRLFTDKLGGAVLPSHVSVIDDPLLSTVAGTSVIGGYPVDDEGVPAKKTVLVEKGVLKSLLTTRVPVPGISLSTGNRRGRLPMPTNLVVSAQKGLSPRALKRELMKTVRRNGLPYGIVIRRIGPPTVAQFSVNRTQLRSGTDAGSVVKNCTAVYRVYADGREELVRNAELTGISAETFPYIRAFSNKNTTKHVDMYFSDILPASGNEARLVSISVPSFLVDVAVVKGLEDDVPTPPLMPPPM